MANRTHKVNGYRIITKKYIALKLIDKESFDLELIDYFFYAIKQLNNRAKTLKYKNRNGNDNKRFYLDKIIYDNNDYIFGRFKTGSYGTIQDFKNRRTEQTTYTKKQNETSDDDVYFYIYKNTGVMLVGNDPNHAINASSLRKYFNMFEYLLENYRAKFNEINRLDKQIYKSQMISINQLPPIDFFEEIKKMNKIKKGTFTVKKSDASDSINVNKRLKELDNQNKFSDKDVEIEISIKNISNTKNFVKDFERLFQILNVSESFDDLKIQGKHQNGDLRVLKNNMPIRTFECVLDYGLKSYPINYVEVKDEFNRINNEHRILFGEVYSTKDVEFVGDNSEVKKEIDALCKKRNKKFPNFKDVGRELWYKN
ncbi:hypothetical protein [Staphylococcus agnetis]|uniref:hypothetical protein n=1 Tax=Staphylococcus agnetis TaxID=985762 RepID=UPI000D03FD63|nr:hypothetical protein [Staphylococcus agnetis]